MKKDGKLDFSEVARFNYELDTNEKLKAGLGELNKEFTTLTETEYRTRMLELFDEAGISVTPKELEMLLILRRKTDQMLIDNKK